MPSLNMPVQKLKVAILPLDLPCSEPVTNSGEILTTGKSHGKKSIEARFNFHSNKLILIISVYYLRQTTQMVTLIG